MNKKILVWSSLAVAGLAIVVSVVLYLRAQSAGTDTSATVLVQPVQTPQTPLSPTTPSKGSSTPSSADYTPDELQKKQAAIKMEKTLPASIKDTWTPEFRAKIEATTP